MSDEEDVSTCEVCTGDMPADNQCLDSSTHTAHHCEDCQMRCWDCGAVFREDQLILAAEARREDGYR